MAKYLYKLGKWAVENKKKVVTGALGFLTVMICIALIMGPSFSDNMSIPGTESEKAGKLLAKEFPSPNEAGGQVQLVMKAPKNETLES